jgi:hypothetical protein
LSIGVPFIGDPALFRYPESSFAGPIEGAVDDDHRYVVLTYEAEHPDMAAVQHEFEQRTERIVRALNMVRGRTQEWNDRLPELLRGHVTARREKLERDQKLSLGYPSANLPLPRDPRPERASAVFRDGQEFDALREFQRIIAQAAHSIVVIDPYVDATVLDSLSGKRATVKIRLLTKAVSGPIAAAARAFNAQHGGLSVRTSSTFHDRFVIVDDRHVYHFGASIKDAGRRVFRLAQIDDASEQRTLKASFEEAWTNASVKIP